MSTVLPSTVGKIVMCKLPRVALNRTHYTRTTVATNHLKKEVRDRNCKIFSIRSVLRLRLRFHGLPLARRLNFSAFDLYSIKSSDFSFPA